MAGSGASPDTADSTAMTAATSSGVASPRTSRSGGGVEGESVAGRVLGHQRGMFPCFLGGRVSRLVRRARRALVTFIRVFDGVMTVSM